MFDFFDICLKIERMAPFAIVSYFLISGILAGDFKLFIVFLGILLSAGLTSAISRNFYDNIYKDEPLDEIIKKITSYNIFYLSSTPISYVPLSINVYVFLLCYYYYVLFAQDPKATKKQKETAAKDATEQNWVLLLILWIFVIGDIIYLYYTFNNIIVILLPVAIGIILGTTWPIIIGKSNWATPTPNMGSKCEASEMKYSCKLNTSGKLITVP